MKFKKLKFLIRVFRRWKSLSENTNSYTPLYRILRVEKDKNGDYQIAVQLIGKKSIFTFKPEEILADDAIVNAFSPTDIRTLTYLGYLGINSPKYKILAKQLSEKSDQMLFAIHKKGEKKYKVITANEISQNENIIKGLSQEEAHMIGLSTALEQVALEKKQKENILKELKQQKDCKKEKNIK